MARSEEPDASAAIIAAVDFPPLFFFVDGGFQFRNAVQGLQGFPSGPKTTPGATPFFEGEDEEAMDDQLRKNPIRVSNSHGSPIV
jgi:hypothetical protein